MLCKPVWKESFPKLRVAKSNEDVCSECHTYHHRIKHIERYGVGAFSDSDESEDEGLFAYYLAKKKNKVKENTSTAVDEADSNDDDDGDIVEEGDAQPLLPAPPVPPVPEAPIDKNLAYDAETDKYMNVAVSAYDNTPLSDILKKAALHVKQADDQRRLCNLKISEAEEDFAAGTPHHLARKAIVVDYSQNVDMPQLGASQPGRSYYYSPLKVFVFGIVNCGLPGGTLDAYVYHEGQGKKKADNVASCIMMFLESHGWLGDETGCELTIIMDNCPGKSAGRRRAICSYHADAPCADAPCGRF